MTDLRRFLVLVWKHWKSGLTGGSLTAFLTLLLAILVILGISGHRISVWAYSVLIIATLFNALFSVWRDAFRSYRAEPFSLLLEECSKLLRFVKGLKNPDPRYEFYPVSPTSFPDNGVPLTEDIRNVIRLMTRMVDYSERINKIFESRKLAHSGPLENWGNERSSINKDRLVEMLEGEIKYLEHEKQEILGSSKPPSSE